LSAQSFLFFLLSIFLFLARLLSRRLSKNSQEGSYEARQEIWRQTRMQLNNYLFYQLVVIVKITDS
jgi:NADH:ubiquinone oxidoreductase subunit 3 (subunit A)